MAALTPGTFIRAAVTVAVLGYLTWTIDLRAAAQAMAALPISHLAVALALVFGDRLLMVSRWALLLRGTGTVIPFKSAAWIFLVSSFVGSVMPAGIRNQFLDGTWDATRVLLEATPRIKATAARLPYVGRFAS
jgi:hypothetical protein